MNEKKNLVFIATRWGAAKGGINVFNTSICSALAGIVKNPESKVACVVCEATHKEREHASASDVELIVLDERAREQGLTPNRSAEVFEKVGLELPGEVAWWIGHDIFSGALANELAKKYGAKSAVIHHMNYEAYKAISRDAKIGEKISEQRTVLRGANIVFAVGPKLANSAKDKISTRRDGVVIEVIPGFEEIDGIPEMPRTFRAITFGRLDQETDVIKLASLGVASFGHARAYQHDYLGSDATITVLGIASDPNQENEERAKLNEIASTYADRSVAVNAFPYTENRSELLDELRTFSASMMLSIHEGFGLAGWEAIAAEVPLIISTNSGLHDLLDRAGGAFLGCVKTVEIRGMTPDRQINPDDISSVAGALREVALKPERAKQDAQTLKGMLSKIYTWDSSAATIANALSIEVSGDVNAETLAAKWQPEALIESLKRENDTVEQAARRHVLYDVLWRSLSGPSAIKKRIILFGGVASSLCDDVAVDKYARWLMGGRDRRLFVAYETGEAARARAATLGALGGELHGLPSQPSERMEEKAKRVRELPEKIFSISTSSAGNNLRDQVHFVPLRSPLSTYIMVFDKKVTITPLFEQRSSETLSFSLSDDSKPFLEDVLRFMTYHLQVAEQGGGTERFNEELEKLRSEVLDND